MNENNKISGLGKLPPQALEFEEAVLGTLMLEKNAAPLVMDFLKPEVFYKDAHGVIFEAISSLYTESNPIDSTTVFQKLRDVGKLETIGGAFKLTELTNRAASSAALEFKARIIVQKYIQREVIRISSEAIQKGYEDTTDCMELVDEVQSSIFALLSGSLGRDFSNAADLIAERLREYEKKPERGLTGISSGIQNLDNITNGWQKSDLIILAARPSMGKTAFALHLVRECAVRQKKPVAVFSLEMSKEQLMDRMIAAESLISMSDIKKRGLDVADFTKIHKGVEGLLGAKILIDDTPGLTPNQLRAKAIRMKQTHDIQMIVLDYLGLMQPDGNRKNSNRTNDIGEISRSLKRLAKELDVPLIALSQLSRKVEDRPGGSKKPRLSDLRDSGDIEQDADIVMFLYRPEYYGLEEDENGESTEKQTIIMVEKHRNGELGHPMAEFDGEFMQFKDWVKVRDRSQQLDAFDNFKSITLTPSENWDNDEDPPF